MEVQIGLPDKNPVHQMEALLRCFLRERPFLDGLVDPAFAGLGSDGLVGVLRHHVSPHQGTQHRLLEICGRFNPDLPRHAFTCLRGTVRGSRTTRQWRRGICEIPFCRCRNPF